ncbi:Tcp11-domain-containing protein, partial [Aureobasidium melanogenum]
MEGNGGRGRRNDSISSVMSVGADTTSPSWTDDNNNARADQRSSRAEQQLDHEASVHMLSQYAPEDPSYTDASTSSDTDQSDMMSPLEIRHAIFELLEELPETATVDLITPYQRAAMLPPVTQESLCELDVGRIINNPKLRHDVNFDRELHFRPNLDGTRGKQKLKSADEYWKALLAELEIYRAVGFRLMTSRSAEELEYWTCMIKANQIRLPGVFSTIHEILKTLVPERDQAIVAERLDVDMIMQQICKGVF